MTEIFEIKDYTTVTDYEKLIILLNNYISDGCVKDCPSEPNTFEYMDQDFDFDYYCNDSTSISSKFGLDKVFVIAPKAIERKFLLPHDSLTLSTVTTLLSAVNLSMTYCFQNENFSKMLLEDSIGILININPKLHLYQGLIWDNDVKSRLFNFKTMFFTQPFTNLSYLSPLSLLITDNTHENNLFVNVSQEYHLYPTSDDMQNESSQESNLHIWDLFNFDANFKWLSLNICFPALPLELLRHDGKKSTLKLVENSQSCNLLAVYNEFFSSLKTTNHSKTLGIFLKMKPFFETMEMTTCSLTKRMEYIMSLLDFYRECVSPAQFHQPFLEARHYMTGDWFLPERPTNDSAFQSFNPMKDSSSRTNVSSKVISDDLMDSLFWYIFPDSAPSESKMQESPEKKFFGLNPIIPMSTNMVDESATSKAFKTCPPDSLTERMLHVLFFIINFIFIAQTTKSEKGEKCNFTQFDITDLPSQYIHDLRITTSNPAKNTFFPISKQQFQEIFNGSNCQTTLKALREFWKEFVLELRYRWDNAIPLPLMSTEKPDYRFSLLHQKFQMLNACICIKKRKMRDLVSESPLTSTSETEKTGELLTSLQSSLEDTFYDCDVQLSPSTIPYDEKLKIGKPEGRSHIFQNDIKLFDGSDFLYVPITQEASFMTEDQLHQHQMYLVNLQENKTSKNDTITLLGEIESLILKSDMSSFKAANPTCRDMRDFLRWYSPADLIYSTSEKLPKLSDRMLIGCNDSESSPNIWIKLWNETKSIPASRQNRLFNETSQGERALHDISGLSLQQILLDYSGSLAQTLSIFAYKHICSAFENNTAGFSVANNQLWCNGCLKKDFLSSILRLTERTTEISIDISLSKSTQNNNSYDISSSLSPLRNLKALNLNLDAPPNVSRGFETTSFQDEITRTLFQKCLSNLKKSEMLYSFQNHFLPPFLLTYFCTNETDPYLTNLYMVMSEYYINNLLINDNIDYFSTIPSSNPDTQGYFHVNHVEIRLPFQTIPTLQHDIHLLQNFFSKESPFFKGGDMHMFVDPPQNNPLQPRNNELFLPLINKKLKEKSQHKLPEWELGLFRKQYEFWRHKNNQGKKRKILYASMAKNEFRLARIENA